MSKMEKSPNLPKNNDWDGGCRNGDSLERLP